MADYSREQIYDAMRKADAAGDAEAVKALAKALQSGASKEQILAQAKDSGLSVNEADLDANIASRDAGGPTSDFRAPEGSSNLEMLGASTQNALAGAVQGVGGIFDLPMQASNQIQRGVVNALGFAGGAGLDALGMDGAADWWRGAADRRNSALAGAPTFSGAIEELSPTPEGMGGARFVAQLIGGAAVPLGPKSTPRVQAPNARAARNSEAADVVAAGEREGVRVMTSDVRPPQSFMGKLARSTGERIPIAGTGGPRVKQAEERVEAVRNLARDFGIDGSQELLSEVSDDLAKTRGGRIAALVQRKNEVIDRLGGGAVEATKAIAEIDSQIARLGRIGNPKLDPVIRELDQFKGVLGSGRSLREIEENRKILGDMVKDDSLASVKSVGEKAINAIYAPLREDMGDYIRSQGGDQAFNAWKTSNDELAAMAGELDAGVFKRVLQNSETTPENVASLLFSKKPSDVRRLYANLSNAGKEKAKAAVLHEAIMKSGGLEEVSPQRFANALKRFGQTSGIVFGDDAPRIEGIVKLLRATQQASVAAATPPTGVQNAPVIGAAVLTDWMGGLGSSATVAGLAGSAARLYESKAVRNLLIGLGKAKAGSRQERRLFERIEGVLTSQSGINGNFAAMNDNVGIAAAAGDRPENQRQQ